MKKILLSCIVIFLTASCAAPRMYYWGSNSFSDNGTTKYEQLAYNSYDKQTPQTICELICLYEDMVSNPGGTRGVVPPGICAEYGFLLLQESTAETFEKYATKKQKKIIESSDYATFFAERGVLMLQKEMELYPESKKFIEPLLKRLTGK